MCHNEEHVESQHEDAVKKSRWQGKKGNEDIKLLPRTRTSLNTDTKTKWTHDGRAGQVGFENLLH